MKPIHRRYETDLRDKVLRLALDHNDTTAATLARYAKEVRHVVRNDGSIYRFIVELDDVEARLDWDPVDGWDGPSTVADTMTKLWLQERNRTTEALKTIERILREPTINDV